MRRRSPVKAGRTAFGLLAISALVTEVVTPHERGTLCVANFASYFTVEPNLFAAVVLIVAGLVPARRRSLPS
jgi:hypothetical protein